jgi:hypothetical protein
MKAGLRAVMAGMALASAPAAAQEDAPFADPKFWVQASLFYPGVNTNVRVTAGPDAGVATGIDLERDLKYSDRKALPAGVLGVRVGRGWHLIGEAYALNRSNSTTLDRDIVFDGVTYPASARVESSFSSSIYRFSVNHDIFSGPDYAVGAALGAHVTSFEVSLAGEGSVGMTGAALQARRRTVLAPLPTLGLHARYRPIPRLQLAARADYLSLKIDDYGGRLLNAQVSADYALTRNLALGVMFRHVNYRLDVTKPDWNGRITYRFTGPAATATLMF